MKIWLAEHPSNDSSESNGDEGQQSGVFLNQGLAVPVSPNTSRIALVSFQNIPKLPPLLGREGARDGPPPDTPHFAALAATTVRQFLESETESMRGTELVKALNQWVLRELKSVLGMHSDERTRTFIRDNAHVFPVGSFANADITINDAPKIHESDPTVKENEADIRITSVGGAIRLGVTAFGRGVTITNHASTPLSLRPEAVPTGHPHIIDPNETMEVYSPEGQLTDDVDHLDYLVQSLFESTEWDYLRDTEERLLVRDIIRYGRYVNIPNDSSISRKKLHGFLVEALMDYDFTREHASNLLKEGLYSWGRRYALNNLRNSYGYAALSPLGNTPSEAIQEFTIHIPNVTVHPGEHVSPKSADISQKPQVYMWSNNFTYRGKEMDELHPYGQLKRETIGGAVKAGVQLDQNPLINGLRINSERQHVQEAATIVLAEHVA